MDAGRGACGEERIGDHGDRLFHREGRLVATERGADPAGRHRDDGAAVSSVARGEAAERHVERGLATAIDFAAPILVIGDAALAGRHGADQPTRQHQGRKRLNHADRAEHVGGHDARELVVGDVGHQDLRIVGGGAGIDEQHVERAAGETRGERGGLGGIGDVERFDLDAAGVAIGEVVEIGAGRATHGADDVPVAGEEFGGEGKAEAAGGAGD